MWNEDETMRQQTAPRSSERSAAVVTHHACFTPQTQCIEICHSNNRRKQGPLYNTHSTQLTTPFQLCQHNTQPRLQLSMNQ